MSHSYGQSTSANEREQVDFISRNLMAVDLSLADFQTAVRLAVEGREGMEAATAAMFDSDGDPDSLEDHRKNHQRAVARVRIALIGGAIAVFDAKCVLDITGAMANNSTILASRIHHEEAKRASKLLAAEFPDLQRVRNALAHHSELSASPSKIAQHTTAGSEEPWEPSMYIGFIFEVTDHGAIARFTKGTTKPGNARKVSFELSSAKAAAFQEIIERYRAAYSAISRY